jgi:hypothetical protein
MKLSDLNAGSGPRESAEESLPYPCSELADPPITIAEARAVDMGRDTTLCRWHRGQFTHLNADGAVYFCPVGRQYWRYTKQPSDFLRPLLDCLIGKGAFRRSHSFDFLGASRRNRY